MRLIQCTVRPAAAAPAASQEEESRTREVYVPIPGNNGTDIAVPVGTEIRAPMAGTVILADPDLRLLRGDGCELVDAAVGLEGAHGLDREDGVDERSESGAGEDALEHLGRSVREHRAGDLEGV